MALGEVDQNQIADGAVTDAKIDTMAASKLTGALPAIDGSSLTNIGGALTGVSAQTASGNSEVDFTSIPSGVNVIKFNSWGASASANEQLIMRLGTSGGIDSTASSYTYQSHYGTSGLSTAGSGTANGWYMDGWANAVNVFYINGEIVNAGGNKWIMNSKTMFSNNIGYWTSFNGFKELSGTLDRVRFTVGSGTWDAGTFRIMYA